MIELRNDDLLPEKPAVSVFCTTYNQVNYISQCLDGFLAQKTNFPFEVLVADDASTDGTSDIVRTYVERRPDVFTAILQDVNQYSQGVRITSKFLWPRSRGRYIALCEGDDWWTDPYKLQRQYDAMEAHREATWCVHASENVEASTGNVLFTTRPYDCDCILDFTQFGEYIQLVATASFFARRDIYASYVEAKPSKTKCHGDFKMSRFFSLMGSTIYLEKPMCAYRVLAQNSTNLRILQSPNWREIVRQNTFNRVEFLRQLDDWSDNRFSDDIAKQINRVEYLGAIELKDYRALHDVWPSDFAAEPLFTKLKVEIFGRSPRLHDIARKFKQKNCPYLGLRR